MHGICLAVTAPWCLGPAWAHVLADIGWGESGVTEHVALQWACAGAKLVGLILVKPQQEK